MQGLILKIAFNRIFVMLALLIWLVFIVDFIIATEMDEFQHCFLDLRISELLRLQHSLEDINVDETTSSSNETAKENITETETKIEPKTVNATTDVCISQNCMKPLAMALTGQPRGYHVNAVYHHQHHQPWHQPEEKPSKLQTFFTLSITALSFLAFGGYLLCLIVQAIKSKGTTYYYPITTTSTTTTNGVKRIKVYRRGRREIAHPSDWVMHYGYGY